MIKNKVSDTYSPGFCEYLVTARPGKLTVIIRLLGVILGLFLLLLAFSLLSFIPQIIVMYVLVVCFGEFALFKITAREFEYTVALGELMVDAIYGRRFRRNVLKVRVADASKIFPIESPKAIKEQKERLGKIVFAHGKNKEYMRCLCIKDTAKKAKPVAIVFSSCPRLDECLKFYNRSAFSESR